jgi:hypothetical protein
VSDPEFAALPATTRRDIRKWHARLASIWHCRPVGEAWSRLSKRRGIARKTIVKKWYALRRAGSWHALLDLRRISPGKRTLRVAVPRDGFHLSIISAGPELVVIHVESNKKGGAYRG